MYVLATGSWQESLVDGWSAAQGTPEGSYHWEATLAGGFWDLYSYYEVSGFVQGVGEISGNVDVYYLFEMSGDITGVGYIFSDITAPEPIRIDGYCYGAGVIGSKFNFSRRRSLYPSLRRDLSYAYKDAPIAAIEYVDFSPNKIINLISYEDSKFENTPDFYLIETLEGSGTFFSSRHYPYSPISSGKIDYLVTDIKAGNENNNPLFYQYELLYDIYSTEDGEVITLYKNNEVKINPAEYVIQCSYDVQGSGYERYSATTWRPFDPLKKIHRLRILLPVSMANKDDFFTVDYDKSIYGARSAQRELLELTPLYQQGIDYIVTSGVHLTSSTKIKNDSKVLYLVKDPEDRIKPIGIEPPIYQPDQISQWRLRLNPGSLLTQSGIYNNEPERFYRLTNKYAETYENKYVPITNVRPIRISESIIQVAQYPIFIDETLYKFPTYQIDLYDKTNLSLTSEPGKVAIEVNGVSRTNIKILSIDRKKGYLQLSETLDPTDEIELDFYVDPDYHIVLENLELNPKISTTQALYKISDFPSGLGVAVREYSSDPNTQYVYLYNPSLPESSRSYYMVPEIGASGAIVTSGSFFSICELDLNRMSTDMVKVTDARRVGGGVADEKLLDQWFAENSSISIRDKDSYVGKAFYGGDPTSFGSSVIIHVPSGVIYSARDRWIASLSGVVADPIEAKDRGTREFNFYLDQVIKRYISAGTDYMLIPIDASGNFMNIMNLNYDYSV